MKLYSLKKNNFYCKNFLISSILYISCSCIPQKKLIYFQDKTNQSSRTVLHEKKDYQIHVGDILSVKVYSMEDKASDFFNTQSTTGNVNVSPASLYVNGYSVIDSGIVQIPMLGAIKVEGLSLSEVQKTIQKEVDRYVHKSTVIVKLVNFKVSVIGEVSHPGYFNIFNDNINVLEAIGLAGDLLPTGNRNKIKVIRRFNTLSEIIILDLTDPNILASKAYFLQPNDVVYVEPLRAKTIRSNLSSTGVIIGSISLVILILNFLNNVSK